MSYTRLTTALVCAAILFVPSAAHAQKLSELLVNLIQGDIVLAPPPPGQPSHAAHFEPGADQKLAPYFFNQQIVGQLATVPVGSSSGGFSFTFDPSVGTFTRATDSFGPSFSERALTNGKGRLTIGGYVQYSKYTSFEGKDLRNGDVKFYLRHENQGGAFYEGDLIEADLNLNLSSTTTTLFANYGVTNNWDFAVAIPIQHVSMSASTTATVLRFATAGINPPLHAFPGGGTSATFSRSGSATGVGDVLLRTKLRFLQTAGGGLAIGGDLRLPSGDVDNLLGSGATAGTVTLIGSTVRGRFAPHFNVGFTGTQSGTVVSVANEFDYRFGTEIIATPKVTLLADVLGRSLRDAGRLQLSDTLWSYNNPFTGPGQTTIQEFVPTAASLNLASVAFGGKFNVYGNMLISANVLVAMTNAGVTARVTPVVGIDYAF